jgi:hypothetical protein
MTKRRMLKSIHLAGTAWFGLCVGYILVFALRQAGFHWWVIFSLSGHSALIVFLLISVYLFAIYRGVSPGQNIEIEHPLTSSHNYTLFYIVTPLLGGLVGCLGMMGVSSIKLFLLGVALGTFATTFLVWVIVDPATAWLELVLSPAARKHLAERLANDKIEREERRRKREHQLVEALAKYESDRLRWQKVLKPEAEKLAGLLTTSRSDFLQAELEAVEIGVKAWQVGGLECMRQVRDMAIDLYSRKNPNKSIVDYISSWWDGIGHWRRPSLQEMMSF